MFWRKKKNEIPSRHRRKKGHGLSFDRLEARRMLTTFLVNNLDDGPVSGAGGLPGSLRQAIFDANENPGADIIEFDVDPLQDTRITLVAGELQVTESLEITGPGFESLTIDGDNRSGIFWFGDETGAATFAFSGLSLVGGNGQNAAAT